jgi:hypothetical protein
MGFEPTTSASAALGVIGFMKAALILRVGVLALLAIWSPFQILKLPE